jgi:hypothetical protein
MIGADVPREGAATTPDVLGLNIGRRAENGGVIDPAPINYSLKQINLTIDRYHMPEAFYQAQASLLSSGSVIIR